MQRVLTLPGSKLPRSFATTARRSLLVLLFLSNFFLAGCDTLQKKHDSPVMVAAPQRMKPRENDDDTPKMADNRKSAAKAKMKEDDGSDIEQVSVALGKKNPWDDWEDDTTIFNSQVAAIVNGAPILNGDVLDIYAKFLVSLRERLQKAWSDPKLLEPGMPEPTPEGYEQFRYKLIQNGIAGHIQKKLLVERLKSGLKPEQLKMMNGHIDEQFEKEIQKLKREMKVSNKTELEIELNKQGTTLQNVKDNFALDRLSNECIAIKSEKPEPIDRPDLIAYYQSHPEKFTYVAKVKWQQIQVSFDANSSSANKAVARKKLEKAISELNRGVSFETVAKTYSDGLTAKEGGQWDWMEAGNLADTKLEKKLFSMPVNQLSDIHEGPTAFSVVRVTEREPAGRQPFQEVQVEIKQILEAEQNRNRVKKLFRELFSKAEIETQYSLPSFVPED